ncbi:hypothetical protein BJG93_34755 (plasmid) [Paraburkholderia sprentiae WSM5005]|uniref:Uncharacterized protein n=1 Tax=Paraburkholderia sprentiae WSM5005 TaxID=754502 RepID=A0ACA8AX79_9BURK|nr:hypothetical protein [Paraburkholderia sprentiae]APA90275.1 hypothetical protein BJG93_34755 [Paraburkholderia sprentiae WSM5005]
MSNKLPAQDRKWTIKECLSILLLIASAAASVLCLLVGALRLLEIHSFIDRLLPDWPGLVLVVVACVGMWGWPRMNESLKSCAWKE